MITNMIHADGSAELALLDKVRTRLDEAVWSQEAMQIVMDVKARGYEAVKEYAERLDGAEPRELDPQELEDAVDRLDSPLLRALEHAAKNIYDYQTRLLIESRNWETSVAGGNVGQLVRGLHRVAIYVPNLPGTCVSAVLMNAIPARVAGVEEIVLVTPPAEQISDTLLSAAWVAGVDRVIAMSGAQAVAALAYGADWIPKADKLVGVMDQSVRTAAALVGQAMDVAMTEANRDLCIIADEAANPVYAAADLLSQAERSETSAAILLTPSETLANAVLEELERQSGALRRKAVMHQSLGEYGGVVLCQDLEGCITLANRLAPANLELLTAAPLALLDQIVNAGCVYLGSGSPEALGEYAAGPCSGVPVAGRAAYASALNVTDFQKRTNLVKFNEAALEKVAQDIINLSRAEEMTANANAVKVRQGK